MALSHTVLPFDDHTVPHGHQAALQDGLDFINTFELDKGRPVDRLTDLSTALAWLRQHELLHGDAVAAFTARAADDPVLAERTLARIRRIREAMRDLVEAQAGHRPPSRDHLSEINRALRTHYVYVLVPAPDGVSLDHRHEGDPIEGALARLTESIAREVSQGYVERLRICADDHCRWVFFDTSRTGRRRWCDMATCGNRAKAARHRERRREATAAGAAAARGV
ncbi:MAG: CGNR zinc finger domain-containing protein [Candidatus Limnocylindrales bacterium]